MRSLPALCILLLGALCAYPAHAAEPELPRAPATAPRPPPPFPASRISAGDRDHLQALLAGTKEPSRPPSNAATTAMTKLAERIHLLMGGSPEAYDHVLITPTHVALVRRSGTIDLVSRAVAEAQIRAGQPSGQEKIRVGAGPKGRPMFAEQGPAGTVRLYRQLPRAAHGEITTPGGGNTSFALTEHDAYHPFGEPGKTVTISIPRALLDRVRAGELGGTGWEGGGLGIDVVEEVQILSRALKEHTDAIPR